MKKIINKVFPTERDLYNSNSIHLIDCRFEGEEDGESALKESSNVKLENCYMDLRYPLWHCDKVTIIDTYMTNNCRAALWYTHDIEINNSRLWGIKALRECANTLISSSDIVSPEFGWKSNIIKINASSIESEYAFFEANDLEIKNVTFKGKYSFQYVKRLVIYNSKLNTKDAFWHAENVTVINSIIEGEYLAWYSKNLTLINCKIIGTQPFCYCDNLKLVDCEMINTDLAFEYSSVDAQINGDILSIKNPKEGRIIADNIKEIIITDDSKYQNKAEILIRSKM